MNPIKKKITKLKTYTTSFLREVWSFHSMRLDICVALSYVFIYDFVIWKNIDIPLTLLGQTIILLFIVSFFCLTIATFKHTQKIILFLLFFISSLVFYYSLNFGTKIDAPIIRATFNTNDFELMSIFKDKKLWIYIIVLGVLPGLAILFLPIKYHSYKAELKIKLKFLAFILVIGLLCLASSPKNLYTLARGELRLFALPVNFLYYSVEYVFSPVGAVGGKLVKYIAKNTKKGSLLNKKDRKPLFIVFVMGESARSGNFSLNGYPKETNPLLSKQDVISFKNMQSCATDTISSVNCLLSHFKKSEYNLVKARSYENILDIIEHSGFDTTWVGHYGCYGVCKRINQVELDMPPYSDIYDTQKDDFLLNYIIPNKKNKDTFIVINQVGSHAGYSYPPRFGKFNPTCGDTPIFECDKEALANLYDNTIVYTDYILNQVIELLKSHSDTYDTAMVYVSDHGESLGENGIFLHGASGNVPEEQLHIPMIMWFSQSFQKNMKLDTSCLKKKIDAPLNHDYLFYSLMGLVDIKGAIYDKKFDVFSECRTK